MVKPPPPKAWHMMTFLNPLDALITKIPFSFFFFAEVCVRVTSGARGSVSVGFWGARQWSPFLGRGGGSSRRGCIDTPPPREFENPPTPTLVPHCSTAEKNGPRAHAVPTATGPKCPSWPAPPPPTPTARTFSRRRSSSALTRPAAFGTCTRPRWRSSAASDGARGGAPAPDPGATRGAAVALPVAWAARAPAAGGARARHEPHAHAVVLPQGPHVHHEAEPGGAQGGP